MRYFRSIGKIIVAGVISVILLSAFSYAYSFSGVHLYNGSGATDYRWSPYQYKANMTEGFSWFRMDEDGFNNERTPVEEVNIWLLGSSHMEAVNVEPNENVGYWLNEMMPDRFTNNIDNMK